MVNAVVHRDTSGWRSDRARRRGSGILPHRDAVVCLLGAVLAEQTDDGADGRRRLGLDILARRRLSLIDPSSEQETGRTLARTA